MSTTNQVSELLSITGQSIKSIVKMLLQSRRNGVRRVDDTSRPLIIMGNGPSLHDTIDSSAPALEQGPSLAVNFAANAPEFRQLKPRYYVLADPHFFTATGNENVRRLAENLASVDWPMTLFVPCGSSGDIGRMMRDNRHLTIERFNAVGVTGWHWLENLAYSHGWGMPRPRNVLIPSIMIAMLLGYRTIYITGADHSWTRTLSVNDRNEVVSIQPHFYKDDEQEKKRVAVEYLHYPLHQILQSFYVAFKSYHDIRRYADSRGVTIYNATPGSFIDAFERRPLP